VADLEEVGLGRVEARVARWHHDVDGGHQTHTRRGSDLNVTQGKGKGKAAQGYLVLN